MENSIAARLLPEVEHEFTMTRKILEQVPDDKLAWKPHERSMTLGRLAGHVAEMPNWGHHVLSSDSLDISPKADGSYEFHSMSSRQDTLQKFDEWKLQALESLKNTADEDFAKTWSLVLNGHALLAMPRAAVLRSVVLNHMIHHRGQLSVYLRLVGASVPGMYGPSADDQRTSAVEF